MLDVAVCVMWQEWTGEMKTREQELKESNSVSQSSTGLPAVRNVKTSKTQNSHVSNMALAVLLES
jgi:hypothetical protein